MKQIKSFLCLALALAFAASCNQNNNTTAPNGESSSPVAGSIVYIQLDSIVSKYDMYNTLKSELEIKVQKIQNDLQARGRALENEQKDFSNKMNKGLMTQAEAEEKYRVLNNKMSDYQNLGARKEAEIQEENAVMMNKVMDANGNYDLAYIGIGRSLLREEKYKEAMKYFKVKYDDENYSKAFKEYRKEWVEDHIGYIVAVILILMIVPLAIGRVNKMKAEIAVSGVFIYEEGLKKKKEGKKAA